VKVRCTLEGEGGVQDDGDIKIVKQGDLLVKDYGHRYSIENSKDETLVFLAIIIAK